MKAAKRLISWVLSLCMAGSLCLAGLPAAGAAAAPALTGSIGLTLRFDLPQTPDNAAGRNILLQVTGGGKNLSVPLPGGQGEGVLVQAKNLDGAPLSGENTVGYYQAELTGLPAGQEYQVKLTGTGYATFQTSVTLDGYSKHLVVGTGDGTFSLGDVNGDQKVDALDLTALDAKLNQTLSASDLAVFDLSGDGKVDITDLTYVNRNAGNSGQAWEIGRAHV